MNTEKNASFFDFTTDENLPRSYAVALEAYAPGNTAYEAPLCFNLNLRLRHDPVGYIAAPTFRDWSLVKNGFGLRVIRCDLISRSPDEARRAIELLATVLNLVDDLGATPSTEAYLLKRRAAEVEHYSVWLDSARRPFVLIIDRELSFARIAYATFEPEEWSSEELPEGHLMPNAGILLFAPREAGADLMQITRKLLGVGE